MSDERDRDRKRAAVMISMLVPAHQMQDAAAIATAASEALGDPEAVSVGIAATMLRGMEAHGLVDRQPYLGRTDGSEWWSLTDAGLVAAQVMRGLMEGGEGASSPCGSGALAGDVDRSRAVNNPEFLLEAIRYAIARESSDLAIAATARLYVEALDRNGTAGGGGEDE